MGLRELLIPRERQFFDLLEKQAAVVVRGTRLLAELVASPAPVDGSRIQRLKEVEHEGDTVVHDIYEALNRTFITPIDREDIASLASALDDVLDFAYATGSHMRLYGVEKPPPELVELAGILPKQMEHVEKAVKALRHLKRSAVSSDLVEIHRLENAADELKNRGVAALFHDSLDARDIIKLKDVYETLETATDKCEDAADVIRDTLVKYA